MDGYCMKCKKKVNCLVSEKRKLETKKGVKYLASGVCTVCGTKMGICISKIEFEKTNGVE